MQLRGAFVFTGGEIVRCLKNFVGDPRPPPLHGRPMATGNAVRVPFAQGGPAKAEVLGERDLPAFRDDLTNSETDRCHGAET